MRSRHALKLITFEDELLPQWAQLLELAASLCPVPEDTQQWFVLFSNRTGVDDARTIVDHCQALRLSLQAHRTSVLDALAPGSQDSDPPTVYAAWIYALDTMIQRASGAETCAWRVDGADDAPESDTAGGDVTLRRI